MKTKEAFEEQVSYEMELLLRYPCAQCGKPAEVVAAFRSSKPSCFGMTAGDNKGLFYPCCRQCAKSGFDTEAIELDAMAQLGFFMI